MQGTNQLVRSNGGLGVLLRDTSTRPGWDRTGNPPTARRLPLPPEPSRLKTPKNPSKQPQTSVLQISLKAKPERGGNSTGLRRTRGAGTYVTKLDHSQLSQLAYTAVGRLWLEEKLSQGHLLASEELPHGSSFLVSDPDGRCRHVKRPNYYLHERTHRSRKKGCIYIEEVRHVILTVATEKQALRNVVAGTFFQ